MAKRGPRKKPTALLKLQGRRIRDRHAPYNADQPDPPAGAPPKPDFVRGDAAAKWDELVKILLAQGTLTAADGDKLEMYCSCWSRMKECEKWVIEHGHVYVTRDSSGRPAGSRLWPQARELDRLVTQLGRIGSEFGLSPSSRTQIKTDGPPAKDELERFINSAAG